MPSPLLLACLGVVLLTLDQFRARDTVPAPGYLGLGLLLSAAWGALALVFPPLRFVAGGLLVLTVIAFLAVLPAVLSELMDDGVVLASA